MTLSKTIHHYKDIAANLHTILTTDARRRVFSSPARAIRWRARAYMYRSLVRKADPDGSSLFDHLIFRITTEEPNVITILREYDDGDAYFETADGQRIETMITPEDARLQEAARELAQRQGIEEPSFDTWPTDPKINDSAYKAQVDAKLAELRVAMRRPALEPSGVDTADPFGWDKKDH